MKMVTFPEHVATFVPVSQDEFLFLTYMTLPRVASRILAVMIILAPHNPAAAKACNLDNALCVPFVACIAATGEMAVGRTYGRKPSDTATGQGKFPNGNRITFWSKLTVLNHMQSKPDEQQRFSANSSVCDAVRAY